MTRSVVMLINGYVMLCAL